MSVFSRAGAGIPNILSEWRQPASRSSLCVGSFLFGRESGHSIARPIACGNRVPPQRTVLRESFRRTSQQKASGGLTHHAVH